ncbi:type II toxin-antitoxin system PemK/MazF family toxin [Phormidesmis sp. 146-12]
MSTRAVPQRSEVWLVNLDPTIGTEIRKIRPAIVVSSNKIGRLPIKLVAPVTDWKEVFVKNAWHIRLEPNAVNGLAKLSAVDTLQLRGLDEQRFLRRIGEIEDEVMICIAAAIALVVEYQP